MRLRAPVVVGLPLVVAIVALVFLANREDAPRKPEVSHASSKPAAVRDPPAAGSSTATIERDLVDDPMLEPTSPEAIEPPMVGSDLSVGDHATTFMSDFLLESRDSTWARSTSGLLDTDFAQGGLAAQVFQEAPLIECRTTKCVVTGRLRPDVRHDSLLHLPYSANCARSLSVDTSDERTVSVLLECSEWRGGGSVPLEGIPAP